MHRVLKESIVEEAVTANRMKIRLSVDQCAALPGGDVTVDLLERASAAHRVAVMIPGFDVMLVSVVSRPARSSSLARR